MGERARVVSIDPSLTGFATAIFRSEEEPILEEMKTKPAKGLVARFDRYHLLVNHTEAILRKQYPELCLIEGYSFNSRGNSGVTLGEFGGVLRDKILGYSDVTVEVPPSVLKKFATGKGNAGKSLVVSALSKRYTLEFASDNQADAFALGQLGLVVLGYVEAETKFQREAADTVAQLIRQETEHEDTA